MVFQLCGSKADEVIEAVSDSSAGKLSYVGLAAYRSLNHKHAWHHHKQWNVTTGKLVGDLQQTPVSDIFSKTHDPDQGHSNYFPDKMKEMISRTKVWCDVMSLGPPDGVFMVKIQEALLNIAENAKGNEKPVIVRFMFGNIVVSVFECLSLFNIFSHEAFFIRDRFFTFIRECPLMEIN
jgi:hypothetical protein